MIFRVPERVGFAIGKRAVAVLISDERLRFRRNSGQRLGLDLAAINRVGIGAAAGIDSGNADAQEHRGEGLIRLRWRAAAVLKMTGGTRTRVEQWSKTIAGGGGRRSCHPVL